MSNIREWAKNAKLAAKQLATLSTEEKDRALLAMADQLENSCECILEANSRDFKSAEANNTSSAFLDRLRLDAARISSMAEGIREIANLADPVGEIVEEYTRPNGLLVKRVRIPLGVIGFIYESRPNVTSDAAALCLKSGNAVILRGGKEAFESNKAIITALREGIASVGLPEDAAQLITDLDYAVVDEMLTLHEQIDLIIPRGGEKMITSIAEKSRIPVLKHAKGVCHVYVDQAADLDKAAAITINSKVRRPSVCNALETLLVHQDVARQLLPDLIDALIHEGVEVRGCEKTSSLSEKVKPASEGDWSEEYLDFILSIKIVDDLSAAIEHISRYGSMHTDTIVTEDSTAADEFVRQVGSSVVLVNASTGFNDGAELGLGAEIGISTSKIHAFGPMGLADLTIRKFVVFGTGQVRS